MATDFIPALRFAALTPWYDRAVAWSTHETEMKNRVVALAAPRPGERVLDLGCGTGTLLLALAKAAPGAILTGLDADPAILVLAAAKIEAAGAQARLLPGRSDALPLPDGRFDLAVSTLFFHHLQPREKHRAVQELRRILRPGGRLVIADFGRATAGWRRGMFHLVRLLDGYSNTRDHAAGSLASFLLDGGFVDVQSLSPLPVPLGSIDFLVATRPPRA
ncbi:MAG: ubiquinone biosynthesis protein UbiE [Arenimonas sp.]|nr:ubiquinone biosynthesis protein UbiE [Arenimonas sp.]